MMYLTLGLASARRRDGETIQNANESGMYDITFPEVLSVQ